MDSIDAKIIQILSNSGKITQQHLSERVGLSLSACQRRVKALEHSRVISGYKALIDPDYLREAFVVLVGINLERHARADIQAFQNAITKLTMVKEVHHIAGQYDFFLKVAVSDIAAYEIFHADHLAAISGIARITSFVTMSTLKT